MNKIETSLLKFLVTFIKRYSDEYCTDHNLVEKMIKNKRVQKLIIDCIYKLEPILAGEVLKGKQKNIMPKPSQPSQDSHLNILSRDVKMLMSNFDSIKEKLSSVKHLVTSIDSSLNQKHSISSDQVSPEENPILESFLKKMSQKRKLFDYEFQDFSNETWEKHFEVEKMLQQELVLYENNKKILANKFFCKLNHVKLKTGDKICRLEGQICKERSEFMHIINKLQMIIEEKNSQEMRRVEFEQKLLDESFSLFYISDLPSAITKIKALVTVRQILEKNRQQDEKVIEGLKKKLQILAEEYVKSQDQLLEMTQKVSSLSLCIVRIIEESFLPESEKKSFIEDINAFDCKSLELQLTDEKILEYLTGKIFIKRIEKVFDDFDNKDSNFKIKIMKCFDNESKQKKKSRGDSRLKGRKKSPNGKLYVKTLNASPGIELINEPESPFNSVKKVISELDSELRNRNKLLTQNLNEALMEFGGSPKKYGKELKVRTQYIDIQLPKPLNTLEKSSETDSSLSLLYLCHNSTQASSSSNSFCCQTTLTSSEVTFHEDYYTRNDFMSLYRLYISQKQANIFTQTEKKLKFKELDDSKLLVKGLMRHSIMQKKINVQELESNEEILIKSVEAVQKTERLPDLEQSKDLYHKELEIFSHFLGYKKMDFKTLQQLWEDVINRRLVEGERDKITSYLRSHFGTENFVEEKQKIISMLLNYKSENVQDNSLKVLLNDFHNKISALAKWRKLLFNLFKTNLPKLFDPSDSQSFPKLVIYYRMIKANHHLIPSHHLKKSDTSIIFKKQDWRLNSRSPIQQHKAPKFSSRILTTRTHEKLFRAKTPILTKNHQKFPILNPFK